MMNANRLTFTLELTGPAVCRASLTVRLRIRGVRPFLNSAHGNGFAEAERNLLARPADPGPAPGDTVLLDDTERPF